MRRILNWVIWLPVTVLMVGFAVANRQWITVSFDPFTATDPVASIGMPLWALLFCGLFIGAVVGWIVCWFGQGKWRRSSREVRQELRRTQDELATLKARTPERDPLPAPVTADPF